MSFLRESGKNMSTVYLKIDDDLDECQTLWRYMDLSKFISLLEKKALWLARADTFRDKHEGRFPVDMRIAIEKAYKDLDQNNNPKVKDADDFQDFLSKNTFINCWHKNFDENMVMWEIYGKDTNALAIQTSVKKLKDNINTSTITGHSLILKGVKYQHAHDTTGVRRYEECFFIKRPHFSFEDEARISLDTYSSTNPTKKTPYGYYLPVSINGLIERILIHPDSPDWFKEAIDSITEKYEIHANVVRGLYGTQ